MSELSEEFEKSESLEAVLSKINHSIETIQMYPPRSPKFPVLLIFGCPRSGTTLFLQWLASLNEFAYPSNLIARFFGNPAFGCEVQKALVDFDKGNQLGLADYVEEYSSSLGRASGVLAPSEFWYYWRQYFKFSDVQKMTKNELKAVNSEAFMNGLGAMESSIGRPLAMKGMIMNWHIPYMAELSSRFIFVSIKRDLFQVAQSILLCRERYTGSRKAWWSFKPPEYEEWLELSPIEQVAAQAVYTQKAVSDGMAAIPSGRKLEVSYAEFCRNPPKIYRQIYEMYQSLGIDISFEYKGIECFDEKKNVRLNQDDEDALDVALSHFEQEAKR
jgi:hypothetical protein